MSFRKFPITTSFAGLIAVSLVACSAQSKTTQSTKNATLTASADLVSPPTKPTGYQKPGAALRFSHDLKQQMQAGQSGTFKLWVWDEYTSGNMTVTVSADSGLTLSSVSDSKDMNMFGDDPQSMDVSFTALTNGRHYLNVHARTEVDGQVMYRSYAVPVQVGPRLAKTRPDNVMVDKSTGQAYIRMEAQETINGVPVENE